MSEPARRQALQQRVGAAILDGAAQIFAVQGEHASMNDVADAAGVARATVYRYFPNRDALLDEHYSHLNHLPFFEGKQAASSRESVLLYANAQLRAVKWHNWKLH